jgi:hypothetical protein
LTADWQDAQLNRFNGQLMPGFESIQRREGMIPASYLFKDVYHQQWEANLIEAEAVAHDNSSHGLLTPIRHLLHFMRNRHSKPGRAYFRVHAYD